MLYPLNSMIVCKSILVTLVSKYCIYQVSISTGVGMLSLKLNAWTISFSSWLMRSHGTYFDTGWDGLILEIEGKSKTFSGYWAPWSSSYWSYSFTSCSSSCCWIISLTMFYTMCLTFEERRWQSRLCILLESMRQTKALPENFIMLSTSSSIASVSKCSSSLICISRYWCNKTIAYCMVWSSISKPWAAAIII